MLSKSHTRRKARNDARGGSSLVLENGHFLCEVELDIRCCHFVCFYQDIHNLPWPCNTLHLEFNSQNFILANTNSLDRCQNFPPLRGHNQQVAIIIPSVCMEFDGPLIIHLRIVFVIQNIRIACQLVLFQVWWMVEFVVMGIYVLR